MNTERLYAASDDAHAALAALDKARNDALYAIELAVADLRDRTGASAADERRFIGSASDGLDDMLHDVRQSLKEEAEEADIAIGNAEHADLVLSRPVL